MRCKKCNGTTRVKDKRDRKAYITRRRECVKCSYRFTTQETVAPPASNKKKLEPFKLRYPNE